METEEHTDNVVRFPKNWVGPTDELVPIGPRARAREASEASSQPDAPGPLPADDAEQIPAAGDFWGEGAAALHHAIRAPSLDPDPSADASAPRDASAPVEDGRPTDDRTPANDCRRRPWAQADQGRPRRWSQRPRTPRVLHGPRSRRVTAVSGVCLVLAAMLVVLVTLGVLGGGDRHASTSAHAAGPPLISFATLRSDAQKSIRAIGKRVRYQSELARARAVARTENRLVAKADKAMHRRQHAYFVELRKRRAASTPVQFTQSDASTDSGTSPDVVESSPSASDATAGSEPSTSDTNSSSAAADSSSGSAPAGPTGVGGSTGGCNPQCR
jgi:hypothetical protein